MTTAVGIHIRKASCVFSVFLLIFLTAPTIPFSYATDDTSLLNSNPTAPVQALTSVIGPEQPAQPMRPAIEARKDLLDWDTQALSPSTGSPFSNQSKVMRVDFSSNGGDLLGLDDTRVFVFGRKENTETENRVFAKVVDIKNDGTVRELPINLEGNTRELRVLGDVSEDHRQLALVTGPQGDPGVENASEPTRLSVFDASLDFASRGKRRVVEVPLSDEMAEPEDAESSPLTVRRVEKVNSVRIENDGTVYLLGEKDEFRYAEKMFECDPARVRDCEHSLRSKLLVGILPVDSFVRTYKDGQWLGEQRFKIPDSQGKNIPFNRIDMAKEDTRPSQKSVIVYGPPVEGILTVLKFPTSPQLGPPAPVKIEDVNGDYAEIPHGDHVFVIMNAVKWDLNGRFFQIRGLEKEEVLGSGGDSGTFSFPGSFHRTVWDRENETRLIFTSKPTAAWNENAYVNIVQKGTNRSASLTSLFRELIGGDKFSLRGVASDEKSLLLSVAKSNEEANSFDEYLLTVAKNDFYSYLKLTNEEEKDNQNMVFDSRHRPLSITIPQGKIFVDWSKKTGAFVRVADGTRVDYDQAVLRDGTGPFPAGNQEIAEYAMAGKTRVMTARPVLISYTDGSYDRVLSLEPKTVAFFSSDGTLLDVRLEEQSLKEALQTIQAAIELKPGVLRSTELDTMAGEVGNILEGVRGTLDRAQFVNDVPSYLQIHEMLEQAETTLAVLDRKD